MKILVIGASSYVGAGIFRDLENNRPNDEILGTYFSNKLSDNLLNLDIIDKGDVSSVFEQVNPNIVIHVAANANARWCDQYKDEAILLNEIGTKNIVDLANVYHAKLIYISSTETEKSNLTIYGATKLHAEEYVKDIKSGYVILRPSLIVGYSPNTTNDRPFNRILKNFHGETAAIYESGWKFQPTYLRHISEVINEIIDRNITNELIPIIVEQFTSRYQLAKDILTPFGIQVDEDPNSNTQEKITETSDKLRALGLPIYTYDDMIKSIVEELKNNK